MSLPRALARTAARAVPVAALCATVGVLAAACAEPDTATASSTPPTSTVSAPFGSSDEIGATSVHVPLSDGTSVLCVVTAGYHSGGVSCDWDRRR